MVSEDAGLALDKLDLNALGRAKKVTISKDDTIVLDGAGEKVPIRFNGHSPPIELKRPSLPAHFRPFEAVSAKFFAFHHCIAVCFFRSRRPSRSAATSCASPLTRPPPTTTARSCRRASRP